MQKDQSYHETAIIYNTRLAECAEELAETLQHEEVKRWCKAVGKQHRFHAKRHESSLENLKRIKQKEEANVAEPVSDDTTPGPSEAPVVEAPPVEENELTPAEKAKARVVDAGVQA